MDANNQQIAQAAPQPPVNTLQSKKPNFFLISLSVIFLILLLITSIIMPKYKSKTKNIVPTPSIISPSPTTIMKEEYVNPFAPTGTTEKQYSNPFEQTTNPFDELAK